MVFLLRGKSLEDMTIGNDLNSSLSVENTINFKKNG